jgi:hypothetical protein
MTESEKEARKKKNKAATKRQMDHAGLKELIVAFGSIPAQWV